MLRTHKIAFFFVLLATCIAAARAQEEVKKYSKEGLTFEYSEGWDLVENSVAELQQISLSNTPTDSQVLITVLRKPTQTKDPMPTLKKQVIDPWLTKLLSQYTQAGIQVEQSPATTEVAGQSAEGTKLKFVLDGQSGSGEAYWLILEKRLILLYVIRPDKMFEKAAPGWNAIRKSLHVEATK